MADKNLIVVPLNSSGKRSRIGDATRVREWLEKRIERTASAADTEAGSGRLRSST